MIAASDPTSIHLRSWVPIDDEHHMLFSQTGKLDRAFTAQERAAFDDPFARLDGYLPNDPAKPLTRYLTKARLENQYNLDLELQKNELMFGVPFVAKYPGPRDDRSHGADLQALEGTPGEYRRDGYLCAAATAGRGACAAREGAPSPRIRRTHR
jgi:hypothetical protein